MRYVVDSFLHFIADNTTLPVHPLRRDPNDPASDALRMNAINIGFGDLVVDQIQSTKVFIDVVNDEEFAALDWLATISTLLTYTLFTPALDYSDPLVPVSLEKNIVWDRPIRFIRVANGSYCHFAAELTLKYQR